LTFSSLSENKISRRMTNDPTPQPDWLESLAETRRELHQQPELSGQEEDTAAFIAGYLREHTSAEIMAGIGGTGLIAQFDSGEAGPSLLFRAELDALPIAEANEFDHRSQREGVAHKCGHDGHAAILLGLARRLEESPPQRGKALLLFQPAEETGEGAEWVLQDEQFERLLPIDHAFALHNLPGFPLGKIVARTGAFTAAVRSSIIRLQGKTAHAAEPEHGISPALAIADILQQAPRRSRPELDADDFAILTPVYVAMGEKAYGTAAGQGEVHLTLRTWSETAMDELCQQWTAYLEELAGRHGLELALDWTDTFQSCHNDKQAVGLLREAAAQCGMAFETREHPFKWGEDFGAFTQRYPGAMFGLGAGEDRPALHNPDYDFPDELLWPGIRLFHSLAIKILQ
jgi:amidohydrolase